MSLCPGSSLKPPASSRITARPLPSNSQASVMPAAPAPTMQTAARKDSSLTCCAAFMLIDRPTDGEELQFEPDENALRNRADHRHDRPSEPGVYKTLPPPIARAMLRRPWAAMPIAHPS